MGGLNNVPQQPVLRGNIPAVGGDVGSSQSVESFELLPPFQDFSVSLSSLISSENWSGTDISSLEPAATTGTAVANSTKSNGTTNEPAATASRIDELKQALQNGTITANQTKNAERVISDLEKGVRWELYQDGKHVTHPSRNFSWTLWKEPGYSSKVI